MSRVFSEYDLDTLFSMMGTKLLPRGSGHWMASCPFGHNHSSGRDAHPSFSVSFNGITSLWKCFGGCNDGGTIRKLARKWMAETGDNRPLAFIQSFDESRNYAERAKGMGSYDEVRARRFMKNSRRGKVKLPKQSIGEEDLKEFLERVPEYAFERGLTKKQIIDWEIGYDEDEDRLIIPVRDMHGKLFGVSGRDLTGQSKIKYRHYPGLSKEAVLYGEKFIDIKNPTCYIVEGFFDVISLTGKGLKNVLATMGTSLSKHQEEKILRWFRRIVFVPDGDMAGLKFAIETGHRLLIKLPNVGIAGVERNADYIRRKKPSKWEPQDYCYTLSKPLDGIDPGDLSLDQLRVVLQQTQWLSLMDI